MILHIEEERGGEQRAPDVSWIEWTKDWTPERARRKLEEIGPGCLGIRGIPNARVQADVTLVGWLSRDHGPGSAGEMRAALAERASAAVDPEEMWALCEGLPFTAHVRFSEGLAEGRFDVVFTRPGTGTTIPWATARTGPLGNNAQAELTSYANDP